ncbi:uncharacterized protein [Kogia breviceps]|uniref:uncharacterized protein n=1 Tax=Kogia breviceps TaxID=27615 RepID=UPI0034D376B3
MRSTHQWEGEPPFSLNRGPEEQAGLTSSRRPSAPEKEPCAALSQEERCLRSPWLLDGAGPPPLSTHAPEPWKHNFPPPWRQRRGLSPLNRCLLLTANSPPPRRLTGRACGSQSDHSWVRGQRAAARRPDVHGGVSAARFDVRLTPHRWDETFEGGRTSLRAPQDVPHARLPGNQVPWGDTHCSRHSTGPWKPKLCLPGAAFSGEDADARSQGAPGSRRQFPGDGGGKRGRVQLGRCWRPTWAVRKASLARWPPSRRAENWVRERAAPPAGGRLANRPLGAGGGSHVGAGGTDTLLWNQGEACS